MLPFLGGLGGNIKIRIIFAYRTIFFNIRNIVSKVIQSVYNWNLKRGPSLPGEEGGREANPKITIIFIYSSIFKKFGTLFGQKGFTFSCEGGISTLFWFTVRFFERNEHNFLLSLQGDLIRPTYRRYDGTITFI